MGKGSKPQDNSGMFMALMMAQQATAAQNQQTSAAQLAWAKQQDALDRAQSQPIIDLQLKAQQEALANAEEDRARYKSVFQPLEDQYVQQAQNWDTPEQEQAAAGAAGANVNMALEAQRQAATRDLEAYGVDPSSTRFAGLDIGARTAGAAALAGSENQAINQRIQEGLALRGNAINIGRGLPGQSLASLGAGVGAGSAGLSGITGLTSLGANTMGTGLQWANLGQQGLNQAGVIGNNYAQNALGNAKLAANSSSGWGSLAGLLGGSILGGTMPTTAAGVGGGTLGGAIGAGILGLFDEGGAIPDPNNPPQIQGAVPITASPTQGRALDDVPARLSPGEFVVPKDVVMWQGEKHFQNLIKKSREQKNDPQQAPAKPEMKAIPTAPVAPRMAYAGGGKVKSQPPIRGQDPGLRALRELGQRELRELRERELRSLNRTGIPEDQIQNDPGNPNTKFRLYNEGQPMMALPQSQGGQLGKPDYPWTQIGPKVDSTSNMPTYDTHQTFRRSILDSTEGALGDRMAYDEYGRPSAGLNPQDAGYLNRMNAQESDLPQWIIDASRGGS